MWLEKRLKIVITERNVVPLHVHLYSSKYSDSWNVPDSIMIVTLEIDINTFHLQSIEYSSVLIFLKVHSLKEL